MHMSGFALVGLVNVVPPLAGVPDGVIVFPVPQAVAWLVIGGVLAMCCALLTLVSAGRATSRRMPVARARRFRPTQPQPQQL